MVAKFPRTFFSLHIFGSGTGPGCWTLKFVLDKLNPSGRFMSHRLYRDSCREVDEKFVKDLSVMGRDLGRVVIFNENPNAYSLQPENVVLIGPFVEDNEDRELEKLARFFDWCERF
ncbi:hypothetical protein V6N13_129066 [Hibiscus sabdariffa]